MILGKASHRLFIFGPVFCGKRCDRNLRCRLVPAPPRSRASRPWSSSASTWASCRGRWRSCVRYSAGCRVVGDTASSAVQKPSTPSPAASSAAMARPRALRSPDSSRRLCARSHTPTWKPRSSFFPSDVAPMRTMGGTRTRAATARRLPPRRVRARRTSRSQLRPGAADRAPQSTAVPIALLLSGSRSRRIPVPRPPEPD